MGQFGKKIQAEQIPGWSEYYLDYKGLKKIVGTLRNTTSNSATTAAASGSIVPDRVRPSDLFVTRSSTPRGQSLLWDTGVPAHTATTLSTTPAFAASSTGDEDRGQDFQRTKETFFFKLQRELDKVRGCFTIRSQSIAEYLCIGPSLSRLTHSTSKRRQSLNCALPL
jgi:CDK inhibitor PHO81